MYIFCLLWTTVWFSLSSFLLFCGWWVSQIALDFVLKDKEIERLGVLQEEGGREREREREID